jgi:hypothetical protein
VFLEGSGLGPELLLQALALRRQPQSLDAPVVGVDLASHEAELLGPVDVIRDRGAVDVGSGREDTVRNEALVADRVEDDPDAERAARALHHALEGLPQVLGREHEIAPDRLACVIRIT